MFLIGRSPQPDLGFFPGDGGVRLGLQVPETLLDKGYSLCLCGYGERGNVGA